MKKSMIILALSLIPLLCACSADTPSYKSELVSNSWYSRLDGGAEVWLDFSDTTASLTIQNSKEKRAISGRYTADENSFVIFCDELSRSYKFDYIPSGNTLKLSYDNNEINLKVSVDK